MSSDDDIKAAMQAELSRKRCICPTKQMAAHKLVRAIDPQLPEDAFELSEAVVRLSNRKPFKRQITATQILVCLLPKSER